MKVKLITKEGRLVGYVEIIPFQIPPEVLAWGTRVFVLDNERTEPGVTVYAEGLLYVLPTNAKLNPKPLF